MTQVSLALPAKTGNHLFSKKTLTTDLSAREEPSQSLAKVTLPLEGTESHTMEVADLNIHQKIEFDDTNSQFEVHSTLAQFAESEQFDQIDLDDNLDCISIGKCSIASNSQADEETASYEDATDLATNGSCDDQDDEVSLDIIDFTQCMPDDSVQLRNAASGQTVAQLLQPANGVNATFLPKTGGEEARNDLEGFMNVNLDQLQTDVVGNNGPTALCDDEAQEED